MAEEIAIENGRISSFEGLVTLTLTLDLIILHTVLHHSSTSIPTRQILLSSCRWKVQIAVACSPHVRTSRDE